MSEFFGDTEEYVTQSQNDDEMTIVSEAISLKNDFDDKKANNNNDKNSISCDDNSNYECFDNEEDDEKRTLPTRHFESETYYKKQSDKTINELNAEYNDFDQTQLIYSFPNIPYIQTSTVYHMDSDYVKYDREVSRYDYEESHDN